MPLELPRLKWNYNIETDLKETCWVELDRSVA